MNKSGVAEQVISLSKGGGALHGMGEKFSPDLHTGTGNFTIPIALPPGRNGFQPELHLVYSTGAGNGPFGLGWSLSVPGVSRKTSKGIPLYNDATDIFILSGAEDLVPISNELPNITRYRPRTEGVFALIDHHRDASNDYWEVRSTDGLVSVYGTPGDAGNDEAVIANPDPAKRTQVFAWHLTTTRDPFGNRIEYAYDRDLGREGFSQWNQLYLARVRYGDYTENEQTKFLVSVGFVYDTRPDPFSTYRSGFEIRTRRRCKRIVVETRADEERLVRSYHLIYLDERPELADAFPPNNVSLLSQIIVAGHDGARREEMPPLEFAYAQFAPKQRRFFPISGNDLPSGSLARPEYELASLFSNGLPDIVEMNGAVRYWRNLGDGRFDRPRAMREAPAGLQLADPGVQLLDANGDGRIDLLVSTREASGYFSLGVDGRWDHRSLQRYAVAPSFNLEDPEVKLVDMNGDGVIDAVRSGSRVEIFFNDPVTGWGQIRSTERLSLEVFPNVNFSDPHVKWADMSGDGLQDIVVVYAGRVAYWPNLGYGNWGPRISMKKSPHLPYGYDPRRILLGDVDGDGAADLVYVDDNKITLWINQSGNGWSEPIVITGTPSVSDIDAVRLVDLLGVGVSGVLWSTDAGGLSSQTMRFLDLTGGAKPYLLQEMDNHMGAVTRVEYVSSTQFFLADEKHPHTRWRTSLPFPVQVVKRVEVIDGLSGGKLTTTYAYHHGYWDGIEREFRGFGRVDQRDTETFPDFHASGLHPKRTFTPVAATFFSPPTETRTWFHQGPVLRENGDWEETDYSGEYWSGDKQLLSRPQSMVEMLRALPREARRHALRALRGRILRTELYGLDGAERQERSYTVTETLHGLREESPPGAEESARRRIFFAHTLAERTTQWERGDDPMTRFHFFDDYDEFGQARRQTQIACPRGWRALEDTPGQPYLATRKQTLYATSLDLAVYITNRIARTTEYVLNNDGTQAVLDLYVLPEDSPWLVCIGQTRHFYDGDACIGLPLGQVGSYGALTRTETLVLTESIIAEAYKSGATTSDPPETPPYLLSPDPSAWTNEYPQAWGAQLPAFAGYQFHEGGLDREDLRGYFVVSEQRRYDFHDEGAMGRGLVTLMRDPLGRDTQITYDAFKALPTTIIDPAGLVTTATYEYRVLQPHETTDPNGNRTAFAFTPLGLLERSAVMGKEGEMIGDTLEFPTLILTYDFLAFLNHRQPIAVRTIRRVHHVHDENVPESEREETIETVEYWDGFGRLLQARTQADEVLWGDSVFGGNVLPNDQNDPNTVADVFAQPNNDLSAPQVIVSGWQTYDNKGRIVEKYEPFFSSGWSYLSRTEADEQPNRFFGQKITMQYDPRGQVIRTMNPDKSEQRVLYGVPVDLTNPEQFMPTPWEAYTYDANDNAGRTHGSAALPYAAHWNTPSSLEIDALGRTVKTVARNGPDPTVDWLTTRSTYDMRGNLLTVTDALGRIAFRYAYDLANRPLRTESLDAGLRRTVLDALGNPIEERDSKGAVVLHAYDEALSRPVRLWARDSADQPITLRERLVYGDSADVGFTKDHTRAANLLGQLVRHYDEAGLLIADRYDFKGNLLDKGRFVIADEHILGNMQNFRIDWEPQAGRTLDEHIDGLLDHFLYRTSTTYDALNRAKTLRYPQDVGGERKELHLRHNRAGALESVTLQGSTQSTVYVEHIAYNAKGQRVLIVYGNGVMTRYAYDPQIFRLVRLRTERYTKLDDHTYHPTGDPLQDLSYTYDLAGNFVSITDRTPGCGVLNNPAALEATDPALAQLLASGDALIHRYRYDPLYRLLSATGRECANIPAPRPWSDDPKCGYNSGQHGTANQENALSLTQPYREDYHYDAAGNLTSLKHDSSGVAWTRYFGMGGLTPQQWDQEWPQHLDPAQTWLNPPSNRLMHVGDNEPGVSQTYFFDANGNLIREHTERHFAWDYADRLREYRTQVGDAEPSIQSHYLYDASGQRVKKLVRRQGGQIGATVYIDGVFEHAVQSDTQNNTLHIMDNQSRVALVRVGSPFPDDHTRAVTFHLGNHLGSSSIVVDDTGSFVNREEYTPYGETSFGSFARKRYRFTGKERDEESGLSYHGARYYAPWLGRWVNCDPLALSMPGGNLNAYAYVEGRVLNATDPSGLQPEEGERVPGGLGMERTVPRGTKTAVSSSNTEPSRPSVRPLPAAGPSISPPPKPSEQPILWHLLRPFLPGVLRPNLDPRLPRALQQLQEGIEEETVAAATQLNARAGTVVTAAAAAVALTPGAAAAAGVGSEAAALASLQVAVQFPRFTLGATEVAAGLSGISLASSSSRFYASTSLAEDGLHLGRSSVLAAITNPQATVLANFMESVERGGGQVNGFTYSLANVERYSGPIISHLEGVFFKTGGLGHISREEVRLILQEPALLDKTVFRYYGFKVSQAIPRLVNEIYTVKSRILDWWKPQSTSRF